MRLKVAGWRPATGVARDAVAGYVVELAQTREKLDSRYDDVQRGKVKLIPWR